MEEASILAAIRGGNLDAFGEIVDLYQMPITRYLYRLTADIEVSQDLSQDTFIQAYKGILKTSSDLALKAWLYKIATNNARRFHRRKRLLSFVPFSEVRKSDSPNQENPLESETEHMLTQEILAKLPLDQRICLVMHFVEGFKYQEIAHALGISEDAVRMRAARGKKMFRILYAGGETQCDARI